MSATDALLAALRDKAGEDFAWRGRRTPWCFGNRAGKRHVLTLDFMRDDAAARLMQGLSDYEFALGGQMVADIIAAQPSANGKFRVIVEALTFAAD